MAARIQVLWWRGCPSWQRALQMVREEMAAQGIAEGELEVIEIADEAGAADRGFPGSPTVRVDGEDLQPPDPHGPIGLTCRVYLRRDGRASPLPDPADLSDALTALRGGG